MSESSKVSHKTYENEENVVGFKFEDILFEETKNGKVKCGICQVECGRLIVHMNDNDYCRANRANFVTM